MPETPNMKPTVLYVYTIADRLEFQLPRHQAIAERDRFYEALTSPKFQNNWLMPDGTPIAFAHISAMRVSE